MSTPVPSSDAERDPAAATPVDVTRRDGTAASGSAPGDAPATSVRAADDAPATGGHAAEDAPGGDGSPASGRRPAGPEDTGEGAVADVDLDADDEGPIPDDVAPGARPATRRRIWKVRQRRAKHKQRSRAFRIAYGVVAALIVIFGAASAPLPGPGPIILVPLGLAMLAAEFLWAERALAFAMDKAEGAKDGAAKATPRQRLLIGAAIVFGVAAAISAVFVLGIPIPLLNPNP